MGLHLKKKLIFPFVTFSINGSDFDKSENEMSLNAALTRLIYRFFLFTISFHLKIDNITHKIKIKAAK